MATNGFTVADAIRRVNHKLRAHAGAVSEADKIEAIDDANQALWRALTMAYRGWFVVESQYATPGQDDYFPQLTDAATAYNLPADLHQVYFVEVDEPTKKDYKFTPSPMPEDSFRNNRLKVDGTNTNDKDYYFDVVGENPARFVLAQALPASVTLNVKIWYVKRLDKLTALTDTLDAGVIPFLDPLCSKAAARLAKGVKQGDLAAVHEDDWRESRAEIAALAQRSINAPMAGAHLDPATGMPRPAGQQGAT